MNIQWFNVDKITVEGFNAWFWMREFSAELFQSVGEYLTSDERNLWDLRVLGLLFLVPVAWVCSPLIGYYYVRTVYLKELDYDHKGEIRLYNKKNIELMTIIARLKNDM